MTVSPSLLADLSEVVKASKVLQSCERLETKKYVFAFFRSMIFTTRIQMILLWALWRWIGQHESDEQYAVRLLGYR